MTDYLVAVSRACIGTGADVLGGLEERILARVAANALSVDFGMFKSQVLSTSRSRTRSASIPRRFGIPWSWTVLQNPNRFATSDCRTNLFTRRNW